MEGVCLYEYMSMYDNVPRDRQSASYVIQLDNNAGFIKKRNSPALISHMRYDKLTRPEEYHRNLLLLFKPWRQPSDVLTHDSYHSSFLSEVEKIQILRNMTRKSVCL